MSDRLPRQINLLNNLIHELVESEQYQEAAGLARDLLPLVEEHSGAGHIDTFRARHSLGRLCRSAGNTEEAAAVLRTLLESQRTGPVVDAVEAAEISAGLAALEEQLGNLDAAERLYHAAIDMRTASLGREHSETTLAMNALGELYRAKGDNQAASEMHRDALERRRTAQGSVSVDVAHSANNLGIALMDLGQTAEAEKLFTDALAIKRELLGEAHFSYSVTLNNLATLFGRTGRREQAEPLLRHVIGLWRETPDAGASLMKVLRTLADWYVQSERYTDAVPLYEELLEKQRHSLGEGHEDVVLTLNNLGMMYYLTTRYADALPHLRRVCELLREQADTHPMLAPSLKNLAALYRKLGDSPTAAGVYRELLDVQRATLKKDDPEIARTRSKLAEVSEEGQGGSSVDPGVPAESDQHAEDEEERHDIAALHRQVAHYYQENQFSKAIDACTQLLELVREQKGDEHEDAVTARGNLATIRDAYGDQLGNVARTFYQSGRFAQALSLAEQVVELKRLAFGEEHAEVGTSLNNVAEIHRAVGNLPESERLHRRALEIRTAACGETHEDVAQSLNNLALTLEQSEKIDEAEQLYRRALEVKKATIGVRAPGYATTLNNLASLYAKADRWTDAAPVIREALDIWRETGQKGSEAYVHALDGLAAYEMGSGHAAAAEPLYRERLALERKRLGRRHPDTAIHVSNLAGTCDRLGKDEAEALYREAIRLFRKAPAPPPALVSALTNLAGHYQQRSNHAAATDLYKEALAITQTTPGHGHPDVAASCIDLARACRERGEFKLALANADTAVEIRRSTLAPTDPELAEALTLQGLAYQGLGDFSKAEASQREAVAIRKLASTSDPSSYGVSLFNLATTLKAQHLDDKAEACFREAGELWKGLKGTSDPGYALSQAHIGGLHAGQGRYKEAEALYRESNEVLLRALGEEHPTVASGWKALGALYATTGRFKEAEELIQRAIDVYRKTAKRPALAEGLTSLVKCHLEQGQYTQALQLAHEVSAVRLAALGPEHPDIADSHFLLATVLHRMGRYQDAEALYRQALDRRTQSLGAMHPDVADVLNNLGTMHHETGRYDEAESLIRKAMKAVRSHYGDAHPIYGSCLNNLADLHRAMGDYRSAERQYHQAFAIWRDAHGPRHPLFATGLSNLGKLFSETGNYEAAKPLLDQALEIRRSLFDAQHPSIARSLKLRAHLAIAMRDDARAIPMVEEALAIYRAAYGGDHPDVAECLHDLAILHGRGGRPGQAEPLHRQAIDAQIRALGPNHPHVAASYYGLAMLCARTGRASESVAFALQAEAIEDEGIRRIFSIGSERQRLQYLETRAGRLDGFLSMVFRTRPEDQSVRASGFDLVLRRKALVTESSAVYRRMLSGDRYPALKPRLNEWAALNMQIAQKSLAGAEESLDEHRRVLADWTRERDALEAEISREIPEIGLADTLRRTDRHAVASALRPGQALVEFVRYQLFDFEAQANEWKPARFCAFVLDPEQPESPHLVDLGEAAAIEAHIRAFRIALTGEWEESSEDPGAPSAEQLSTVEDEGRVLREVLFDPLLPHLGRCTTLRLALDGALSLLPFEALPLAGGLRVIDRYAISYVNTGRELLARPAGDVHHVGPVPLDPAFSPAGNPVVVADPDFDLGAGAASAVPSRAPARGRSHNRARSAARFRFDRLPGTRLEGEQVGGVLGVSPLLGGDALEARIKAVRSPRVLHIATHGYFLPGVARTPRAIEALAGEYGERVAHVPDVDDPLLRSGLALAGANGRSQRFTPPAEAEDGILTAADVCGLDLHDTDLVVLSACQTGLGDIHAGEGVFGLRRAFMLAGAKSLVVSLWHVPDDTTQELMAALYTRLLAGVPAATALREAQLEFKKTNADPYFWGAFVCHGDASVVVSRPATV